jgi:hypothetical protein
MCSFRIILHDSFIFPNIYLQICRLGIEITLKIAVELLVLLLCVQVVSGPNLYAKI